jgi:endoglucanase
MFVIIDWHDHHASDYLAQATKFFAEVAQKYGDKPNIIYEPYNEPLQVSWKIFIKPYHQSVIDTIRKYDPDNLIIYGTTDATGDGFVNQSETNLWYDFLDANKLSWCNWSIADKAESSAALISGSSASGNWMNIQLTASGSFVRQEMRNKNLRFK